MDAIWCANTGLLGTSQVLSIPMSMPPGILKAVVKEEQRQHQYRHQQTPALTQMKVAYAIRVGQKRALVVNAATIAAIPTMIQTAIGVLSLMQHAKVPIMDTVLVAGHQAW